MIATSIPLGPFGAPAGFGNIGGGMEMDVEDGIGELSPGQSQNRSSSSSDQTQQSSGETYQQDPALAKAMAALLGNVANETGSQYSNFVSDPTSSPIFQNALKGLMGSLAPSEDAARGNLNDQFRAAGNTASSTFGQKAKGLESDILRNRQTTASQLLTTLFPQVANALYQPLGDLPGLINSTKLQKQQSTGESTSESTGMQGAVQYSPATGQKVPIPGYTSPYMPQPSSWGIIQ